MSWSYIIDVKSSKVTMKTEWVGSFQVRLVEQDRLGLEHSTKDANVPSIENTIDLEFFAKLRKLLKTITIGYT